MENANIEQLKKQGFRFIEESNGEKLYTIIKPNRRVGAEHVNGRNLARVANEINDAMNTYQGWANYETWNATLTIENDFPQYQIARRSSNYRELIQKLAAAGYTETLDGVNYADSAIDEQEVNDWLRELNN